jgi:hypothetical protein
MYILKIKGTPQIPDFVQLRDNDFTLMAYFRIDNIVNGLGKAGLSDKTAVLQTLLDKLPFGILQKIEI